MDMRAVLEGGARELADPGPVGGGVAEWELPGSVDERTISEESCEAGEPVEDVLEETPDFLRDTPEQDGCGSAAPPRASTSTAGAARASVAGPNRGLGAIAQLGERLLCKQEVTGSIPVGSTKTALCEPWPRKRGRGLHFCAPWWATVGGLRAWLAQSWLPGRQGSVDGVSSALWISPLLRPGCA